LYSGSYEKRYLLTVTIQLNGKIESIAEGTSVSALLALKSIVPAHVVVEKNSVIVARDAYPITILNTGDTLELLRFVGGG